MRIWQLKEEHKLELISVQYIVKCIPNGFLFNKKLGNIHPIKTISLIKTSPVELII